MLNADSLVRDGKPDADALAAAPHDPAAIAAALAGATAPAQRAALALLAGAHGAEPARAALLALLADDGLAGKAAAWALGQDAGASDAVLAAIAGGGVDVRDNGYQALAVLVAGGRAPASLTAALTARAEDEIARAQAGRTGLGEKACRVLTMLGAPGAAELIQRVLESDPYTDRFELDRLRKRLADQGRDHDSIAELAAPWPLLFADQLAPPPKLAEPVPAPAKPVAVASAPSAPRPLPPPGAGSPPPVAPPAVAGGSDDPLDPEAGADNALPPAKPIDWKAFATSPEVAALPAQVKTLITQLGPLLEQLAARAINAPLADLSGQEFMALLLQVLPQALPPEHVSIALSPQALNGYQALAKWLVRSGTASHGSELELAVKAVRKQLTAQMRKTGMLGGPDYSDPDDAPVTTKG